MSQNTEMPPLANLLWPTLKTLAERGNSASIKEIEKTIARRMELSDEVMSATYEKTGNLIVKNRIGWALDWLKGMKLVDNAERGIWTLTPLGIDALKKDERGLLDNFRAYMRQYTQERKHKSKRNEYDTSSEQDGESEDTPYEEEQAWKGPLLTKLMSLTPNAFKDVCFRVLRKCGYEIEKTEGGGYKGIDGVGIGRLENLISFHIAIQCKRYDVTHLVGHGDIRNFLGALTKKTFDRGLFITTGQFTKAAEEEAQESRIRLELIDGDTLCELFEKHGLGLKAQTVVDDTFFEDYT